MQGAGRFWVWFPALVPFLVERLCSACAFMGCFLITAGLTGNSLYVDPMLTRIGSSPLDPVWITQARERWQVATPRLVEERGRAEKRFDLSTVASSYKSRHDSLISNVIWGNNLDKWTNLNSCAHLFTDLEYSHPQTQSSWWHERKNHRSLLFTDSGDDECFCNISWISTQHVSVCTTVAEQQTATAVLWATHEAKNHPVRYYT